MSARNVFLKPTLLYVRGHGRKSQAHDSGCCGPSAAARVVSWATHAGALTSGVVTESRNAATAARGPEGGAAKRAITETVCLFLFAGKIPMSMLTPVVGGLSWDILQACRVFTVHALSFSWHVLQFYP